MEFSRQEYWSVLSLPLNALFFKVVCAQLCLTLCDTMDCSPPGSTVHGIFQARILEQVAISYSRRSSRPKDQTHVFRIGRQIRYRWHHHCFIALHLTLLPRYCIFFTKLKVCGNSTSTRSLSAPFFHQNLLISCLYVIFQ